MSIAYPLRHPTMVFVDGSNVLVEMAAALGVSADADKPTDHRLNLAGQSIGSAVNYFCEGYMTPSRVTRRYWFGSVQGSDEYLMSRRQTLRNFGYEAELFRKVKGRKEKGVDLAVARYMLTHGFNKNYDTAILVAGDEDYLGLVEDIKRQGRLVCGVFYNTAALSPRLKLSFDHFCEIPHPQSVNQDLYKAVMDESRNAAS